MHDLAGACQGTGWRLYLEYIFDISLVINLFISLFDLTNIHQKNQA